MTLPPLRNLFAAFEPDLDVRNRLRARLEDSHAFTDVAVSRQAWLVGGAPLPGALGTEVELTHGFVFGEGGDRFAGSGSQSLTELARLVDTAPQELAAYAGDFGFIRFREDGATLVRSCSGRVPLYYFRDEARIYLASRLDYLVAFAPLDRRLDGLATSVLLGGCSVFPEGRTPICGVRCLPAGHYLVFAPHATERPKRYWFPRRPLEPGGNARRREEQAARLREILLSTLRRELEPGGGNLLSFSGGLDSSALAALAHEQLGLPLLTQTFTCPDPVTARYEEQYIVPLEQRYAFARSWREPKTAARCLQLVLDAPRVSLPVQHIGLGALAEIARQTEVHVAIDGEFADEGCGSPRRNGDWLDHTSLLAALRHGRNNPLGRAAVLRWLTWRAKRPFHEQWLALPAALPEGTRADIEEEYRAWVERERRRFADDTLPQRTLAFRVSQDQWVAEAWEVTTSLGARPVSPFYTREALELYFSIHPLDLFDGTRPKAPLREALRGYLPDTHRLRPDKGDWPPYLAQSRGVAPLPSTSRVLELLDERWLSRTFGKLEDPAPISAEMSFLDALRMTALSNMLSAIDRLAGPNPF